MPPELQNEAVEKEGIKNISRDMNNGKNNKIEEIRLDIIDGSRKTGEEDRTPKIMEQKGRNKEKLVESEKYNNGHATREDLLEENEDVGVEIKANDVLLQTEGKIGTQEERMSAVADTGDTCTGISDKFYNIPQEERLPTALKDEQSEKEIGI